MKITHFKGKKNSWYSVHVVVNERTIVIEQTERQARTLSEIYKIEINTIILNN